MDTCLKLREVKFLVEAMENNLLYSSFQVGLLGPLFLKGIGRFSVIWYQRLFSLSFMDLVGLMFHFLPFSSQISLTERFLVWERAYSLGYLRERMPFWLQFECQKEIWSPLLISQPWLTLNQMRFFMMDLQGALEVLYLPNVWMFPMWVPLYFAWISLL